MLWLMLVFMMNEGAEEPQPDTFKQAEIEWRAAHEETMKDDDSWLNVVGLFFLKEGANPFGTSQDFRISLPKYSTVNEAGVMFLKDGKVTYEMARAQRATIDGKAQNEGSLELGQIMTHNHLRMFLIERGGKIALRVRDLRARSFLDFKALDFYRPKKKYQVEAEFTPFDPPKKIKVTTVISTEVELLVPGIIRFELEGQQLELTPTLESMEDEQWLIMFQDQTSGSTTYSGGRFLYIDPPKDGKVDLNFNRAVNPPCAYTIYATCPLPPSENWLDAAIEAGERAYHGGEEH